MCNCEFTPYPEDDSDFGEESWHYLRKCLWCGNEWWGLHCPHDGAQNPCPSCHRYPIPIPDLEEPGNTWRWEAAPLPTSPELAVQGVYLEEDENVHWVLDDIGRVMSYEIQYPRRQRYNVAERGKDEC